MNISDKQKEIVFSLLSSIMNGEDVINYLNLGNALSLIKGDGANWQSLASIGVHTAILYADIYLEKDVGKNAKLFGSLVEESILPVENLHKNLTGVSIPSNGNPLAGSDIGEELSLTDYDSRLLFYTRFALGFLLLAKGDKKSAINTFLRLAETQFLQSNREADDQKPRTANLIYTSDIGICKSLVVKFFLPYPLTEKEYSEYMNIITKVLECPDKDKSLFKYAVDAMDLWAFYLEKEFPNKCQDWNLLLSSLAEILKLTEFADHSHTHPKSCRIESPQFLAWKFGQYLGQYISHGGFPSIDTELSGSHLNGLNYCEDDLGLLFSDDYPFWDVESLYLMIDILDGIKYCSNYKKLLEDCLLLWNNSPASGGLPLDKISSRCDLYWTVKIGIIEKLMEKEPETTGISPASSIETILTRTSLEMMKISREFSELKSAINSRLPKSADEITVSINDRLKEIWNKLPKSIINSLVKAEKLY